MRYTADKIKEIITEKSFELNFSAIGFAKANPLDTQINHYNSWLSENNHGKMKYLENYIDKREDPRLLLKNAKTIIIFQQNYFWPDEFDISLLSTGVYGLISRYARGSDYHKVIKQKLYIISEILDNMGYSTKVLVDTGPVLEKQWAEIAGLGWQGKNSLVISRNIGSWFFIGTMITDAEIPPDLPSKNYCGTCTKCIDACPTGAIKQPGVIDATKCIAYWTIEVKAETNIPDNIASHAFPWVYGCDICQEVCPWNIKYQQKTNEKKFKPNTSIININEINMNSFKDIFKESPVNRLKYEGLKRNINDIFLKRT